jgi:hypothetical protein
MAEFLGATARAIRTVARRVFMNAGRAVIIDSRGGLTLRIVRLPGWYWRRWLWIVRRPGGWEIEGRSWTRRTATIHGSTCRALMLAARSPVATRRSQDDLEGWR